MTTATREQILREMGLGPVWKLRIPVTPDAVDSVSQPHSATNQVNGEVEIADRVRLAGPASAREAALPEVSAASLPTEWEPFARVVASCKQCALCERRKQAVVGGEQRAEQRVGGGLGAQGKGGGNSRQGRTQTHGKEAPKRIKPRRAAPAGAAPGRTGTAVRR